jgi:hypothetical protein
MIWKGSALRLFFVVAILISTLLLLTGISTQIALATTQPFRPGHPVFPLQDFAEQMRAKTIMGKTNQAVYYLELALQRTEDLFNLAGGEHAFLAMVYLERALDQSIEAIVEAPEQDLPFLSLQLVELIQQIELAIAKTVVDSGDILQMSQALQAKVSTLQSLLAGLPGGEQVALAMNSEPRIHPLAMGEENSQISEGSEISPLNVHFPPGSPGAVHEFFPLEGEHAQLDCTLCHPTGQYAGTAKTCTSCHEEVTPLLHFDGECATCHNPVSWQAVDFDHALAGAIDCLSCHEREKSNSHYQGQCSACHNTIAWAQADLNHQAIDAGDCKSCHQKDKPDNHYQGQCSACHNTNVWRQAVFNHQVVNASDCIHCHAGKKPANHYSAQCSACHNTSNWRQITFNHQAAGATDCISCHSGVKPSNHYSGGCSACHNTSSWSGAKFNHSAANATDCKSCHKNRKPANHFSGQCSACHSTSTWSGASFNHGAAGATDCKACHGGKKPENHFSGQCSQCHSTSSWGGASFKHSFPIDHGSADGKCGACHPSGGSKYNCYVCHDKDKILKKHNEEGIASIGGRCLDCHRDGKEGDDD